MLNILKNEAALTYTENGAITNSTSGSCCLDLFFRAGGMRNSEEKEIAELVIRSYCENPEKTMKIIFFIRDVRGGLGERRFSERQSEHLLILHPQQLSVISVILLNTEDLMTFAFCSARPARMQQ